MEKEFETKGYDTSTVYDYKVYPDVHYGRCDNCDYTLFKSSVKDVYSCVNVAAAG